MNTKEIRKNKGITLIALVITIIVLLILAGVTIATLTGDNGILSKATQAKEQTEVATEKEQVEIAYMSADMNKTGEVVTVEELQAELDKMAKTLVSDNGDGTFNVFFEDSKNNYKVENGAVSETVLTEEKMNLEKGSIQIIDKQTNEIISEQKVAIIKTSPLLLTSSTEIYFVDSGGKNPKQCTKLLQSSNGPSE